MVVRTVSEKTNGDPQAEFPTVPAEHLGSLIGLTDIGGDALHYTEALYE